MRIHRLLAGSLTVSATVAAGAFVAAPAHAALTGAQLYAVTNISHASGCTSTVSSSTSNTSFSDDGNPVTQNQSVAGTISNGTDITQVATSGKGTIKVRRAGGSLSTVDFTGTASAKAVPSSSATACAAYAQGYAYATFGFSVAHPGWIEVSSDGTSSGYAFQAFEVYNSSMSSVLQTNGSRMTGTHEFFLPAAGTYTMLLDNGATAQASSTSIPQHSQVSMKTHVSFTAAGGSLGAASGSGTSYVHLAQARNCTGNNVAATFTSQASKVKTASFFVNGAKKKTVLHPAGGTSVLLSHLADSSSVTVKAVLALKSGGSATATRSYVPCS